MRILGLLHDLSRDIPSLQMQRLLSLFYEAEPSTCLGWYQVLYVSNDSLQILNNLWVNGFEQVIGTKVNLTMIKIDDHENYHKKSSTIIDDRMSSHIWIKKN